MQIFGRMQRYILIGIPLPNVKTGLNSRDVESPILIDDDIVVGHPLPAGAKAFTGIIHQHVPIF